MFEEDPHDEAEDTVEALEPLLAARSREEVFEWGVSYLQDRLDADEVTIATATHGVLVPAVSEPGNQTGREHAIPIFGSVSGGVYDASDGCIIDDLQDTRGNTAAAPGSSTPNLSQAGRAMVCAPLGDVGVVIARSRTPDAFTAEDLQFVEGVGTAMMQRIDGLAADTGTTPSSESTLLDEIASVLSHDLRNKISIATGRLELAEETHDSKHFESSRQALQGIEALADMVVTLARSGDPVQELEPIQLKTAVETVFQSLEETTSAQLIVKANGTIMADSACLRQILENVLRNAIEHTSGPPRIEVGLLENGFYVADDGPGVPEENREDVFELGFSTGDGHAGTGLSIVAHLTRSLGWEVTMTESSEGGARVEFTGVIFR